MSTSIPTPTIPLDMMDAVRVYAVVVAGVIASITAAVGLLNLRLTRKNLDQQRELAQGSALQAYYKHIDNQIFGYDLRNTPREEMRELARGQTLAVLQKVDRNGKQGGPPGEFSRKSSVCGRHGDVVSRPARSPRRVYATKLHTGLY